MAMDPNGTDALFEIIRKELNTIIENGEKKLNAANDKGQPKSNYGDGKAFKNPTGSKATEEKMVEQKSAAITGSALFPRIEAGEVMNLVDTTTVTPRKATTKERDTKLSEMQTKFKSTLEKDIANQTAFLNSPRSKSIDADLQKMQIELQESYNLFQGISEKFETINFHNLQKRIKELNLTKKREAVGADRSNELKAAVEEGFKTNRLDEMTTKVGEKFNKHPGEFGNIPELSSFFQACTQLEHVLGNLKRQRSDVRDLEERMRRSAEISYNRVSHIKKQLEEQEFINPARMQDSDL